MTAIPPPEPTVRPVAYQVTCVPEEVAPYDSELFAIYVQYAGSDRWAVRANSRCLDAAGRWDYEPTLAERGDAWLDGHRFDLDTALELAKQAAPHVNAGGRTVEQALTRKGGAR